jgi:chromosome segregation ATPase
MLSMPLIAQTADVRQEKHTVSEAVSRRVLTTNESAVVAKCVETLKQHRSSGTSEVAEQRREAVAKLDQLRHVATLPALDAVARDETESSQTRVRAVKAIARTQDKDAVPVLIDLISIPDTQVYGAAIEQLENVTGAHLGSAAYSSQEAFPGKRAEMRQKWQAWWKANSTAFKPREDAVLWHRD